MKYPGEVNEAHPEVFNSLPPSAGPPKDGQLSAQDFQLFFEQGFIIVDSFFKDVELEDVKATIDGLVDDLARRLYKAGKIKRSLQRLQFFPTDSRKLENDFPGASVILHKIGAIPESFKKLWSNQRLLNLAEQILGTSNIGGHPVWNLRTKVPNINAAVVPWHQDAAYLNTDSYKVFQLTAWIPLIDSNFTNGCMQVLRYGHKTGKVARHTGCWKDTWYLMLEEKEIERTLGCNMEKDTVTCEVPYGGLLLISNVLPHRSLPNISGEIRWSLDLRWQDACKPNGFYGLKNSVLMRTSGDEDFKVNWQDFDAINRHDKQDEDCHRTEDKDEFDVTITGPWMKQWELVNKNKHTKALEALEDLS